MCILLLIVSLLGIAAHKDNPHRVIYPPRHHRPGHTKMQRSLDGLLKRDKSSGKGDQSNQIYRNERQEMIDSMMDTLLQVRRARRPKAL